ncbi:MAG TPA: ATP-binding protein [Porticoccaceae bacterium]|nr:ATP-binding protein [Porticoccaceae bacterium]
MPEFSNALRSGAERPSIEQPFAGQPFAGQPFAEQLLVDNSFTEHSFTEHSFTGHSFAEQPVATGRRAAQRLAVPASEPHRLADDRECLARRLAQLLEALPGGVLVIDDEGVIQCANAAAGTLLGGALVGHTWAAVLHRLGAELAIDGDGIELPDGRHLRLRRRQQYPEPGQVLLLTDSTDQQLLRERIDREQRLAALGEMVAGLAHQIRTPLATALLFVSQLADPALESRARTSFAERALERLRHLEGVVDDMLGLVRGVAVAGEVVPVQVLIEDLVAAVDAALGATGGTLSVHNRVPGASVQGSRELLASALLNLATNALQACAGRVPQLRLEVVGRDGAVELILADNGPGIPAALRERVFTPFFTTRRDGTGLGLPMARRIAQAYGGDLRLHPATAGARIGLYVPIQGRVLASGTRGGALFRAGGDAPRATAVVGAAACR